MQDEKESVSDRRPWCHDCVQFCRFLGRVFRNDMDAVKKKKILKVHSRKAFLTTLFYVTIFIA